MKNERQAVIPNSGPDVDAAAYAIGRMHKGEPPAKLGVPKAKMGLGRRGPEQPKQTPKYKRYDCA
jgi:hypothetical protein